jgi:carbamoylphosphate synthase large subunit
LQQFESDLIMLTADSPRWQHAAQNIVLIVLSIAFQPLDLVLLFLAYTWSTLSRIQNDFSQTQKPHAVPSEPCTILVTGVSMTKGLTLARVFHRAGHRVIGADSSSEACGGMSNCVDVFYQLKAPTVDQGATAYIESLLDIILKEKVDLWVSCSGVASAAEDGEAMEIIEARSKCRAVQFNLEMTKTLHEKGTFIEYVRKLGLTVPETHIVTSSSAAEGILRDAPSGRKFIMKPIGVDDSKRADMTLLPKDSPEQTSKHLARLGLAESSPFIIQQFIQGPEFCTHALVVRGEVKVFVACPSAELLMHYEALPPNSPLSKAMLNFTKKLALNSGKDFTGHLSFDFLIEDTTPADPDDITLYPIECNPRAHTAVVLFSQTIDMAAAYLNVLPGRKEATDSNQIVVPFRPRKYYWIGHDLLGLVATNCTRAKISEVWEHVSLWHDGTFEFADPLPWFWLYHIYWPSRFLECLTSGTKWSRINVSTGKIFEC